MMRTGAVVMLICGTILAQAAAAQAPDYGARLAELERRYAANPDDPAVLDALAGSYAMAGRYPDAIEAARKLALLQPEVAGHRVRVARLYAWAGDAESALRELRSLGDRIPADAAEFECTLRSWTGDSRGAARCYAALLEKTPRGEGTASIQLGAARNLAWSGDAEGAVRTYRAYLSASPEDGAAAVELARVLRYQGRLSESEETLSTLLKRDPNNVPALALQSEVLHWRGGRSRKALGLARQALRIDPNSMEARIAEVYALRDLGDRTGAARVQAGLRERVRSDGFDKDQAYAPGYTYLEQTEPAQVGVGVTLPFSTYNDSDGIHQSLRGAEVNLPVGNHVVWAKAYRYDLSAPESSIFSYAGGRQHAEVLTVGGALRLTPAVGLEYFGGAARPGRNAARPVYGAGLRIAPADRVVLHLETTRSFLMVTPRSIGSGIASTRAQASLDLGLTRGASLALEANRSFWNDGNRSVGGSVGLTQTFRPSSAFFVRMGSRAVAQSFAYDLRYQSGFFTPDWNDRYEGLGGVGGEIGRALSYEVSASAGAQRVSRTADFRATWDVASAVTLRLGRTVSVSANYEKRNYSILGGAGQYQGAYFQLNIQRD